MVQKEITVSHRMEPAIAQFSEIPRALRVFGARTHNLRNLSVDIPLGRMTVITGISGSGKSSLAFDTIFAEGRHRYLASISARSRELLQTIDRPDVDWVDGLPPVLCIEQRLPAAKVRATVATVSEIYDYLCLLFARVGQLYCPNCHEPVTAQSRADIVDQAIRWQDRQKVVVLAPIVQARAGSHADVFARIVKDGFVRARLDGEIIDAASPPEVSQSKPHNIEIVIDRLILKDGIQTRLEESVDLALQLGKGQCILSSEIDGKWQDRLYSSYLACPKCGTSFPAIEPRSFSFNSASGACPSCQGLGFVTDADESERVCDACHGTRLTDVSRSVLINGTRIVDFCSLTAPDAGKVIDDWQIQAVAEDNPRSAAWKSAKQHILPEIASRLRFLNDVGLDYITLDRRCQTLSAGEFQRVRLAASLGNQLTGVCYILDEPTAGLHSSETQRLLQTLNRLRDGGNTLIVVEHDLDVIRQADYVIELGPGAGVLGGLVVATGAPIELAKNPASITGQFLTHAEATKRTPPKPPSSSFLKLTGATLHNLKNISLEVPQQQIVCVTGVSGSGKTSLVIRTLVPAVRRALGESIPIDGPYADVSGVQSLSRLVQVDQSPLGKSARSSPATYSGIWNEVRRLFAKTKESQLRGFDARRFSLAEPESRCPRCSGRGELAVDEQRFSDWTVRCPECDGLRFAPSVLSVRYRGQSVADLLEMSLSDAGQFFQHHPRIAPPLSIFNELGLGYLKLGQSAATLSGGEAQRIKLGTELAKSAGMNAATLYVLDEPTSGLHPADVRQLLHVLRRLVAAGNSVLVIEHNPTFIEDCDWTIEIGPGAGSSGGRIVSAGPNSAD